MKNTDIVVVGNSCNEIEILKEYLQEAVPVSHAVSVHCFLSPLEAYTFLCNHDCHLLFTGINLRGMDGITFCKKVQEAKPDTAIVLTTSYDEHVLQALQSYIPIAGYLPMPTSEEAVRELLVHRIS